MTQRPWTPRILDFRSAEKAEEELCRIGVDPAGIAIMLPKMFFRCIHIPGLQCRQGNILKQEMLSLGGDAAVARGTVSCSIENTDAVLMGTDSHFARLCKRLSAQPFGLAHLGHSISALLEHNRQQPSEWRTATGSILLTRPLIMGILNITPDSFSDGGRYYSVERAVDHALLMADEGADIIDIGGESTRPGAQKISAEEELARVLPIIEQLSGKTHSILSIDTWKSSVAKASLAAGAGIINDISGLTFDQQMASVAAQAGAGVVLMHTRGTPETMQSDTVYGDIMLEVVNSLSASAARAENAGIAKESIVVDPGIGFAKDAAGNRELLRRLSELKCLGFPLLVGTSRKSFIGATLGREVSDRLHGTSATIAIAVANGAAVLRVHDVKAMRDAADMAFALTQPF